MVKDFIETLISGYQKNADSKIAAEQKIYMGAQIEYFGIETPRGKEIQNHF